MIGTDTVPQAGLSGEDLAVLPVGCATYARPGDAENAVHALGVNRTRFDQRLNRLLDDPRALLVDLMNVNRLRRLRVARTTRRFR